MRLKMENPITAIVFIAILGLLAYLGRDRGESEVTHEKIAENEVPAYLERYGRVIQLNGQSGYDRMD
ncbi:hypothetical protein [Streptococcus orisratti]